eukprot:scaffold137087_cov20-Prasinocladus_malaysianus.AAC.1
MLMRKLRMQELTIWNVPSSALAHTCNSRVKTTAAPDPFPLIHDVTCAHLVFGLRARIFLGTGRISRCTSITLFRRQIHRQIRR